MMRLSSVRSHVLLVIALSAGVGLAVDAASTSFWQVSTQAEFLKGEVEQVSIDSDGRVSLAPSLEEVHDVGSPAVWRLLVDANDTLWAGTGNDGKVWKVERDGKATVAYDAAELEVHALAAVPGGGIYAASSPDGKVYRLPREGAATPFYDPEDKYIWSLAVGSDGTVYVGTGEKGRIYKVDREGKGTLFYDTETTHVTSLVWDPRGSLLVGTASPGRVLRIDPSGTAFVLLESAYKEIRGLRIAPDGQIYVTAVGVASGGADTPVKITPDVTSTAGPIPTVSTEITVSAIGDTTVVTPSTSGLVSDSRSSGGMQKGAVYRIAPDGEWMIVWESPDDIPYDVVVEPSGALLIATGSKGKLFRLSGNPTLTTLVTRAEAQQITAFAQDRSGRLVLATANPGRILRIAATPTTRGTYLSEVKDTATVATWGAIRWRAATPSGSAVELYTRSGNTRAPDKTWSPWSKAYKSANGELIESPKARYLQWKALLTRSGSSAPLLTSVSAAFLPRNTRPVVDSITVHAPGVVFQRPYPTGDPELAGFDANTADGRQTLTPNAASSAPGPTLGRRAFQRSLQTFVWQARDNDGDRLQFDVYYRLEGDTNWKLLKRALFDEIYTWDTTSAPDGSYVIKVVASDSPTNAPPTALQGERESSAFDIDNTPPTIETRDARATPNVVTFTVRDGHSPIQRVEYAWNGGRWNLAYPVDGLLDSREERFELKLDASEGGAQNGSGAVVLRVSDALGNVATAVIGR
jgi:sugar lactone lactonase YvrE